MSISTILALLLASTASEVVPFLHSPIPESGHAQPAHGSLGMMAEPNLSVLAAAQAPTARQGTYFRLGAGLVTTTDSDGPGEEIDFDEGYMVALALGKRFGNPVDAMGFALELEGFWSDQDTDDDSPLQAVRDVTAAGVLLNGMVDYRFTETLSAYGGAGLGVAWMDIGTQSDAINDFDDEDGPFLAWQARAGLQWWSSESVAWNLGYRFLNVDDVKIDDDLGGAGFDLETSQHVIELGFSLGF